MKYLIYATLMALGMCAPAHADGFEGDIPTNVCWWESKAYSIGSHNPAILTQFRSAVAANVNQGYGKFCVLMSDIPTWVYMDYDHTQERWVVSNNPLVIE